MKGKKVCPKCGEIVGARRLDCPHCLHYFGVKGKQPKSDKLLRPKKEIILKKKVAKQQLYDIPGRGRKYCRGCEKYLGLRIEECSCGYKFEHEKVVKKKIIEMDPPDSEKEAKEFVKILTNEDTLYSNVVLIPRGECPIELNLKSREGVFEWCDAVFFNGSRENRFYTPSALRYFAREFFSVNSSDYTEVVSFINEWVKNKELEYAQNVD